MPTSRPPSFRDVAPVPLFQSRFAYTYQPLPLYFDSADDTHELRTAVLSRCGAKGHQTSKRRNRRPTQKPEPTIRDLPVKNNPWRDRVQPKRLFPMPSGRKSDALKRREKQKAARAKPRFPKDERTFLSMLTFFDATCDDVDCFIDDGDLETITLHNFVQQQIKQRSAEVRAGWSETHRQWARTGLTKEDLRNRLKEISATVVRDPYE